jgi:hypothetical protein
MTTPSLTVPGGVPPGAIVYLTVASAGGAIFSLGPRASRKVMLAVRQGQDFSPDVIPAGPGAFIRVQTLIDGLVVGGMTYAVDPVLKLPPKEHPEPKEDEACKDDARLCRFPASGSPIISTATTFGCGLNRCISTAQYRDREERGSCWRACHIGVTIPRKLVLVWKGTPRQPLIDHKPYSSPSFDEISMPKPERPT